MTAQDMKLWRKRHKLSLRYAAAEIGCSVNSVIAYERGQNIPKYIALACAAYSQGIPPLGDTDARLS